MEYFKYDYKNVDNNFTFNNYDSFITNMKTYKYYLFDLALLQNDSKTDDLTKSEAKRLIRTQKLFFLLPYVIIFSTFFYYHKRNYFQVKMLQKETRMVCCLFMFVLGIRAIQKALLKYEGDKILIPCAKNKNHSI